MIPGYGLHALLDFFLFFRSGDRGVTRALTGGGVYSYIRVLPDEFLLNFSIFKFISKEISRAEHEYMNIHPSPPINALVTPLSGEFTTNADSRIIHIPTPNIRSYSYPINIHIHTTSKPSFSIFNIHKYSSSPFPPPPPPKREDSRNHWSAQSTENGVPVTTNFQIFPPYYLHYPTKT